MLTRLHYKLHAPKHPCLKHTCFLHARVKVTTWFRFPIQWSEDGNRVQASSGQRAADHLPPLLPPAPHLLRHHLFQTFLLRGSGDGQPYRDAGHHNTLRQVGDIIILCFAKLFSIHIKFISNVVFPVSWGSFRPLPTFVWWTFGSYLDNSSPLWRNENHLDNIICLKQTSFIYHFLSLT